MFESVGYDTNLPADQTYVITSVDHEGGINDKTNTIWLNLGITRDELAALSSSSDKWDQRATSSYTYVKSGGATTPESLREANRRAG